MSKRKINLEEQARTPYVDALKKYVDKNVVAFNVPGHHGTSTNDLADIFGENIFKYDLNCPYGLDNILISKGCIKEAEELYATFCGAKRAKFLVNGSSSGNLIMFLSVLKHGDKIILPRNIHKSVTNALILSGAVPIFINPSIEKELGISLQVSAEDYIKAINENRDAKAVFIINPTYFGYVTDIAKIIDCARLFKMFVLVDEAHGSHFYFSSKMPKTAMELGADMSVISMHKTGGSLTQSSVLLINNDRILDFDLNLAYSMATSTSPSSFLLASLDAARKYMVLNGKEDIKRAIELSVFFREKIKKIPGFYVENEDFYKKHYEIFGMDPTKVCIGISQLSKNGFELYKILADEYNIQIELAEEQAILFLITIGTTKNDVEICLEVLKDLSRRFFKKNINTKKYDLGHIKGIISPREAYLSPSKIIDLDKAENMISKETIVVYPPGIPIIMPGEVFTKEIISQIKIYQNEKATILADLEPIEKVLIANLDK